MFITRSLHSKLEQTKRSFLLLGPRQTGKSTLIRSLRPDLEINLSDEETYVRYLSDPGLLSSVIRDHKTIFIDEVQRIPSLLNTVQFHLDQNKSLLFYLTGSSARKLRRGKANLLPGRIFTFEIGPLCLSEVPDLEVQEVLQKGLLPGIYTEHDGTVWKKLLKSYAISYLKEEIQAESLTRNLEGFSRFFQVIASRSGDILDILKFASHAEIERSSAKRYFEILEDTLVLKSVEPFTKSSRRRLIQHPRYYFFDVGVLNGCLGTFDTSFARIGTLLEHLVLQLITSACKAADEEVRISFYRTEAGAEVDFIIERAGRLFALEVKASKKIGGHDFRGLRSFAEFYGKKHTAIVAYLGTDELQIDGIEVLALTKALNLILET